ncbi:MAG: DUF2807 domain-containing protein [Muribaculum sp.]|nr:DUF2807 domain-containing protein [Muribaculum sp.]
MKSRSLSSALTVALILASLLLCGSVLAQKKRSASDDTRISKNIKIGDFNKIDVDRGIVVNFRQADNPGYAVVKADPEIIDFVEIKLDGNELEISYNKNNINLKSGAQTVVTVSSRNFTGAEVSSAASLRVKGNLVVKNEIDLEASSASKIQLENVTCPKLEIDCSSSASVEAASLVGNLDVDASSASSVGVSQLQAEKIDIEASSAASISLKTIRANVIDVEASSASKISLSGQCNYLKKDISSGASLHANNLLVKNRK